MNALKILGQTGGDWILIILLLCSVLAVAVIIERAILLYRERRATLFLLEKIRQVLRDGKLEEAKAVAAANPCLTSNVLLELLEHTHQGIESLEERLAAARLRGKILLEKRLLILGTLGANAPFIGLFGTVLGIIKAFHDLAFSGGAGPEVVMAGLADALIATALGLMVAIPSVIAFNYFQKRLKDWIQETEYLARLVVAELKSQTQTSRP